MTASPMAVCGCGDAAAESIPVATEFGSCMLGGSLLASGPPEAVFVDSSSAVNSGAGAGLCGLSSSFVAGIAGGFQRAVGALRGACSGAPLSWVRGESRELNLSQDGLRTRLEECCRFLEPPPSRDVRSRSLADLLKVPDLYCGSSLRGSSTRPYDADKVRIVKEGAIHPKSLKEVVGPDGKKFVLAPGKYI